MKIRFTKLILAAMCMAGMVLSANFSYAAAAAPAKAAAKEDKGPVHILFKNVNIFDGYSPQLKSGMSVLVKDNKIQKIGAAITTPKGTKIIDGTGKTLMPGLIDGHAHVMINAHFDTVEKNMDLSDISIRSVRVAERFLLDGFTSVRDMGGPAFALARNINNGRIPGPRIYPSVK